MKFRWETEFKETEIGEIPKDWKAKMLGELCNITSSKRIYFKEYSANGVPFYRSKEIILLSKGEHIENSRYISTEKYEEIKVRYGVPKPGDLLLTAIGTIGYVYMVRNNDKFYFKDGNILWLKDFNEKINQKYLYFFLPVLLKHQEIYIGSSQRALTIKGLKGVKISCPSTEEQTRIATVLSWFDDLIENKKRQNEILENMSMAIFKSWFIDFEPFQDGEFVYSEELDMEIPKGWKVKPIGEIAEVTSGFSYKGSEKLESPTSESYIFITLNNTVEGGGFKPIYSWIKSERIKQKHLIKEGELILPNTEQTKDARLLGSPGIVVFPPDYDKNYAVYSMDVVKVTPIEDYNRYYLYFNFKLNREEIATFHSGTNILHFKIQNFKENYYIPVPPQPILQRFHSLVEPFFRKIMINQKEIMVLKKIRDTLLPQLVFGRLRVEEI